MDLVCIDVSKWTLGSEGISSKYLLICRCGSLFKHVGGWVQYITSHLMFLKSWKWQKNVAVGTGHRQVIRKGVFKSLRWCGKSASCGRRKANYLFILWRFGQGFGGQWMVPSFPFGTEIFPSYCLFRVGRGSQGGRRLWWITAGFWSWLASKNFCQFMSCTAFILLKRKQ